MEFVRHLTTTQQLQLETCGMFAVDEEPTRWIDTELGHRLPLEYGAPEGWRILTEPCDSYTERKPWPEVGEFPNPDCVGGRRVVTLTATCPNGATFAHDHYVIGLDAKCGCVNGVVTLGRFTLSELLRVRPRPDYAIDADLPAAWVTNEGQLMIVIDALNVLYPTLDPLPQPGGFIVRPEKVET